MTELDYSKIIRIRESKIRTTKLSTDKSVKTIITSISTTEE